MKHFWWIVWGLLVLWIIVWKIQHPVLAQNQNKRIEYYALEQTTPETLVVLKVVPNSAIVCAELNKGMVACRTVGDFRSWVRERPVVKAK